MNAERYITSKDVLEQAGISRATLNNYISQGLLPRPVVAPGNRETSDAPRIGHFPESILATIDEINALKREGLRLAEIAARLDTRGEGTPLVVYNPLAWARSEPVRVMLRLKAELGQAGIKTTNNLRSSGRRAAKCRSVPPVWPVDSSKHSTVYPKGVH